MSRAITIVLLLFGLILLCFPPIIPTSVVFQFSVNTFDRSTADPALTAHDVDEILNLVSNHPDFHEDDYYLEFISIKDYLLYYGQVGILLVAPLPEGVTGRCDDCSALVDTGMLCGALCGLGTTFYLVRKDNEWAVKWAGKWVS